MPAEIPILSKGFIEKLKNLKIQEIALEVSRPYLSEDLSEEQIINIVENAINFSAPVINLDQTANILELFHGPTLAFKDFGARFMAHLMSALIHKSGKEITILVATSGDTGSAVAHGFLGVPGIQVIILYPSGKVSEIQEKQLTTMGQNVTALEVEGVFDDCQKLVKQAFLDSDLTGRKNLTSANSINIARLLPQSFYYFYGVGQLLNSKQKVVVAVPSGNFGNLTAGLIAKRMGLPVEQFIAATNANNIVPEYLESGEFSPRPSVATISNAMDVGNPSNFARIQNLYSGDLGKIRKDIWGKSISEEQTRETMREVFEQYGYCLDPHGAVGYKALELFRAEVGSDNIGLVLETAHPAKFRDSLDTEVNKAVKTPERLESFLSKEKQSIKMSNSFSEFKEFLIN